MAAWTSNSTRALWDLLTEVVNHQAVVARVGDFNQALMELGATVCTQRNSNCERCPLASSCVARRLSMQDSLPRRRPARPSVVLDCVVVLLRQGERILMHVNRDGPFPRDLWELPRITGLPDRDLEQHFAKEHGLLLKVGTVVKTVAHLITHHRIRIHVVEASLQHTSIPDEYRWIDPNEPEVGLSGYVRKVLRGLAHPVHAAAD
jgi:A/G-specific adenine glycosylase